MTTSKDKTMSSKIHQYLLVDDDDIFISVLTRALTRRGQTVYSANSVTTALEIAAEQEIDRVIVDLKMEGLSGLSLIEKLKQQQPKLDIIMLTGYSSIATTVEAIKLGAINYLCKPASVEEILLAFGGQLSDTVEVPDNPPSVDRLEWEHIQKVLAYHDGNISATARALGMHRRTLQRKLYKKPVQR
jgi:two-component system response regulator RegA